jgi:hypothetical protein
VLAATRPVADDAHSIMPESGGLMRSSRGVGFGDVTDLKEFRRACHGAAQRTGGTVSEFRVSKEPTPNFHQGVIAYADRSVAVVCLRDSPVLALAVPRLIDSMPRQWGPLTFVDDPGL